MQEPITDVLVADAKTIAKLLNEIMYLQGVVRMPRCDHGKLLDQNIKNCELVKARRKKLVKFFKAAQAARNEMLLPTDRVMDTKTHTRRRKALLNVSNRLCSAMNDLDNDETVDDAN